MRKGEVYLPPDPHGLFVAQNTESTVDSAVFDAALFVYSPAEKRKPKGAHGGGQWTKGGAVAPAKVRPESIDTLAPGISPVKIAGKWVMPEPPDRVPTPGEVATDRYGVRWVANVSATRWLQERPDYDKNGSLVGGIDAEKPVYPEPGEYHSVKQAAEGLHERYPGPLFDFKGLDLNNVNAMSKAIAEMAEKYPDPYSKLNAISTGAEAGYDWSMDRSTYAVTIGNTSSDRYVIHLNPLWFGSDTFPLKLQSDIDLGWHPSNMTDAGAIFRHEFGHVIDFWMIRNTDPDVWDKWKPVATGGYTTLQGFSKYGKTKPQEERAEVFGAMETSPEDMHLAGLADGLGRIMDTALSRIFPGRKPWVYHQGVGKL